MKKGFTCGAFDLLHAGHAEMLEECKKVCDYLIVGLQSDPTLDRSNKNKPVQTMAERYRMLKSIKYVDEIVTYDTEADLVNLLKMLPIDIRIVGADWKGKEYTGRGLPIEVYFNTRNHSLSTSELRNRVYEAELAKKKQKNVKKEKVNDEQEENSDAVPVFQSEMERQAA